jgi:hypothetical protein
MMWLVIQSSYWYVIITRTTVIFVIIFIVFCLVSWSRSPLKYPDALILLYNHLLQSYSTMYARGPVCLQHCIKILVDQSFHIWNLGFISLVTSLITWSHASLTGLSYCDMEEIIWLASFHWSDRQVRTVLYCSWKDGCLQLFRFCFSTREIPLCCSHTVLSCILLEL